MHYLQQKRVRGELYPGWRTALSVAVRRMWSEEKETEAQEESLDAQQLPKEN
tara:strand:- start:307 stop:462 length:156 start_codon:yes stop_codon:yes gene_type:complete